ncbi:MAG: 23S rRNA (uracil(1939)-C(5))-methyltransferase RlmD [Clostridia bacterium]
MIDNKKCYIHKQCGGCNIHDIKYEESLVNKTNMVKDILNTKLDVMPNINNIIGMNNPYNYRNKAKYVFGYNKTTRKPIMGFFLGGTHKIIEGSNCMIQDETINEIASYIAVLVNKHQINIYNEDAKKGFLRHLVIKVGMNTKEVMVIFVTTDSKMFKREVIIKDLINKFPNIKTIVQNINDKQTNFVLGDKNIVLYGNGYIMDYLGEYKFKISANSFYQVNSIQTELIYNTAIKFACLKKSDIVYDLYSGIGTISLFVSKYIKKGYGIEIISDAVKDARQNAKINKINNIEFIQGKVEMVLPKLYKQGIKPDVIFVDPPRSGLDKRTIKTIIDISPNKVIYISCNPVTLAFDLSLLKESYNIDVVQPVDMFPFTRTC